MLVIVSEAIVIEPEARLRIGWFVVELMVMASVLQGMRLSTQLPAVAQLVPAVPVQVAPVPQAAPRTSEPLVGVGPGVGVGVTAASSADRV